MLENMSNSCERWPLGRFFIPAAKRLNKKQTKAHVTNITTFMVSN